MKANSDMYTKKMAFVNMQVAPEKERLHPLCWSSDWNSDNGIATSGSFPLIIC